MRKVKPMLYDVILEAVNPAFRNPTVAALVTLAHVGIRGAIHIIEQAPCPVLERRTHKEAQEAKRHLEAGFFPSDRDWQRPNAGITCCTVTVRKSVAATTK
jgi:hypothetical protein